MHTTKAGSFFTEHHSGDKVLFWSDLVSVHYAQATVKLYSELSILFVLKELNLPNVPNQRLIEHLQSILKERVYREADKFRATDEERSEKSSEGK